MRFFLMIICLTATIAAGGKAWARPVSYPGGWTVMQMNDGDMSGLHLHYSPSINYSVGYKGEYWHDGDWQFHGAQLNILAKRWNMPQSQANFYIKNAVGIAHSDKAQFDNQVNIAGFSGVAVDWENRRFFTSYENRANFTGGIDDSYMQKIRLGVAPYIGDYGDLHTWAMVEVRHSPESKDPVTVTPLVRFFKGDYLAEIGVSSEKKALFNLVKRF